MREPFARASGGTTCFIILSLAACRSDFLRLAASRVHLNLLNSLRIGSLNLFQYPWNYVEFLASRWFFRLIEWMMDRMMLSISFWGARWTWNLDVQKFDTFAWHDLMVSRGRGEVCSSIAAYEMLAKWPFSHVLNSQEVGKSFFFIGLFFSLFYRWSHFLSLLFLPSSKYIRTK